MITIRQFQRSDLNQALELIERSISTNRSVQTWLGNNMTAVLALDGIKLIGIIPFEPRRFSLGGGNSIDVLWVSAAHVEPEYRSRGIGAAMDEKTKEYFSPEFKAVFVYRQDEASPAYRWYRKIGFCKIASIISLKKDVEPPSGSGKYIVLKNESDLQKWEGKLYEFFKKHNSGYGGFSVRHNRFWSDKFKVHYYKEHYSYSLLLILRRDDLVAYAFTGRTNMKDGVERLDVLEASVSDDTGIKDSLHFSIVDFAHKHSLKEIRVQVLEQGTDIQWWKSYGFIKRWKTNMMGKFFEPLGSSEEIISKFPLDKWRYFHIDYI